MAEIDYFDDPSRYGGRSQDAGGYSYGAEHDPYGAEAPEPSRFGALVNWAGALVSLGLVVGMGVWAWQLTIRDVSGVPVIEALEGPMRVPPQDPGGAQAPHQGLAVNRIAEGEAAEPVPDQVALAPPPVGLEDVAPLVSAIPEPAPRTGLPADVNAETQALIDRLLERGAALDTAPIAPPDPLPDTIEAPAPLTEAAPATPDATPEVTVIPASVPGVSRSLRPTLRPASTSANAVASDVAIEVTTGASAGEVITAGTEIAPSDLPVGTRLVQLGAFDSADIARSEWERLSARFPDYLGSRARVIEEARSGGQAFYRLRAHGFDDLAEARRFCTALVARGAACIPVTVR